VDLTNSDRVNLPSPDDLTKSDHVNVTSGTEIIDLTKSDRVNISSRTDIVDPTKSLGVDLTTRSEIIDLTESDRLKVPTGSEVIDLTKSDRVKITTRSDFVDLTHSDNVDSPVDITVTTPPQENLPSEQETPTKMKNRDKGQIFSPIDLDLCPVPSDSNSTPHSSRKTPDNRLVASAYGIQMTVSSFLRFLTPGEWLDDICIDFFGLLLAENATLDLGCRWISWAQMNTPPTRKLSALTPSSTPSVIVAPVNWLNIHWGLIGYSFLENRFWSFDSMNSYLVSRVHRTSFIRCCSEIFPGRFSSAEEISFPNDAMMKQRDGWSCGLRCLYFLLSLCDPHLDLPQDTLVEGMRSSLLDKFRACLSEIQTFPALKEVWKTLDTR